MWGRYDNSANGVDPVGFLLGVARSRGAGPRPCTLPAVEAIRFTNAFVSNCMIKMQPSRIWHWADSEYLNRN